MSRLNILKAIEELHLPIKIHENAYRFLFTLETTSSRYYNPHAAKIIRKLLFEITRSGLNKNKQRDHLIALFLGQIESLLLSTQSGQDEDSIQNELHGFYTNDFTVFNPISKVNLQEKIDSYLYGTQERDIYAIENYYPKVSFSDKSASLMIHSSVMRYLHNTPDVAIRQRKLDYLTKKAEDANISTENQWVCRALANYLNKHIDETNTDGGESFDRMFRKLVENKGFTDTDINRCIKVRNKAVHEGICQWDYNVVVLYLTLLFCSEPGFSSEFEDDSEQIEQGVKTEVAKDRRNKRISSIISCVISVTVIGFLVYVLSMFVVGSYIGESDIDKVWWDSNNSEFNARVNEIIATKDTTQLLQVQKDLQWIQDAIYQSSKK